MIIPTYWQALAGTDDFGPYGYIDGWYVRWAIKADGSVGYTLDPDKKAQSRSEPWEASDFVDGWRNSSRSSAMIESIRQTLGALETPPGTPSSIREYLELSGDNGASLARKLGVSRSFISLLRVGRARPNPENASEISRVTGIPVMKLLFPEAVPARKNRGRPKKAQKTHRNL